MTKKKWIDQIIRTDNDVGKAKEKIIDIIINFQGRETKG